MWIHFLFCFSICLNAVGVAYSSTPINSVIFLILTFCNSALILFILNAEFLGLIFIIIYVGAVAVLFLFVIMMINIKAQLSFVEQIPQTTYYFLVLIFFLIVFYFSFFDKIYSFNVVNNNFYFNVFNFYDELTNIDLIGQLLYNNYVVCVLLAGVLLLVALIGCIVLTVNLNGSKHNHKALRQLSRSDVFISFFK